MRIQEHLRSCRNPSCPSYVDKPLAKHRVASHASRMPSLKVKILESCRDKSQRKILEAFQIKKQRPPINSREEMATALSLIDLWVFKLARWHGSKSGATAQRPSASRATVYISTTIDEQALCLRWRGDHPETFDDYNRLTTTTLDPNGLPQGQDKFYHLLRCFVRADL